MKEVWEGIQAKKILLEGYMDIFWNSILAVKCTPD